MSYSVKMMLLAGSWILVLAVVDAPSGGCPPTQPSGPAVEVDLQSLEEQWASVGIEIGDISRSSPELEAAVRSWIATDVPSRRIAELPGGEAPELRCAATELQEARLPMVMAARELAVTVVGLRTGFVFDGDAQAWFAEIDVAFQGPRDDVLRLANRLIPRFFDSARAYVELRDDQGVVVGLSPPLRDRGSAYADMNITFEPAGFYIEELPSGSIRLLQPLPLPLVEKPELATYSVQLDGQEFERIWRMGNGDDRVLGVDTRRAAHRMKHVILTVPHEPSEY